MLCPAVQKSRSQLVAVSPSLSTLPAVSGIGKANSYSWEDELTTCGVGCQGEVGSTGVRSSKIETLEVILFLENAQHLYMLPSGSNNSCMWPRSESLQLLASFHSVTGHGLLFKEVTVENP